MTNLRSIFPRASQAFIDANRGLPHPESERAARNESAGKDRGKETHAGRRVLRYTSYRCQLLDPDNGITKFFTDALRYCGAIRDDTSADIELQVRQKKVEHHAEEKTLIELF